MASTTRRKSETTKNKETKPVVPAIGPTSVVPSYSDYLSNEDMRTLETLELSFTNAQLAMSIEEQVLANMNLKLELLKHNIEKQKAILSERAATYNQQAIRFDSFKKELWPKYGVTPDKGLGYDPKSGRIVRAENK